MPAPLPQASLQRTESAAAILARQWMAQANRDPEVLKEEERLARIYDMSPKNDALRNQFLKDVNAQIASAKPLPATSTLFRNRIQEKLPKFVRFERFPRLISLSKELSKRRIS
jgi:hypothetical protein